MSAARPHICFVIPSLEVGGTERQLHYLVSGLAPTHEITVVCTRREGVLSASLPESVMTHALGLTGGWDLRARRRLYEVFQAERPDVVHSFMFGFDYTVNVAARKAGVATIVSSRRQLATWKKSRHIRLQKKANSYADEIVANSEAVARFSAEQEGEAIERFRVIPNGIDVNGFEPVEDSEFLRKELSIPAGRMIVGMVANFSPVKDHALFVEIAKCLNGQRKDAHFLLVGDGPLREATQQRVESAGLADRFTFASRAVDIAELYGLMSVVVLCSKSEGSPNTIMEAMAAHRPVVAARVGGVPELIEDGVTGRLVDTRSGSDFAECIADLLDHPITGLRLVQGASQFIRQQRTVEALVSAHASMYGELMAGAAASGAA